MSPRTGTATTAPVGDRPDPMTLPAAQRARRDRIIAAAMTLLAGAEYESVQMRDIADEAGVALGTLYRYFSSKEHLYAEALVAWAADYGPRRTAGGGPAPADDDEARLRSLMRRAVRAFERAPQMFRAQMVLERSTDPNARARYDEFVRRNTNVLTSALHNLDPATSRSIISTVNCVMSNHLRSWAHGRCSIGDVERAVQRTIDLIFGPGPTTPPNR